MKILELKQRLQSYSVFSLQEVRKVYATISYAQMSRWTQKGYIKMLKQGFYMWSDAQINDQTLLIAANSMYAPSYVSLESALRYYNLIPEAVFTTTSVTTKNTTSFVCEIGKFSYQHLKPSLFWGYRLQEYNNQKILLAEPEKAVLDYLYLNSSLTTTADFMGLRINTDSFNECIDTKKFNTYLAAFNNKTLTRRTSIFLQTVQND